MFWRGKAFAPVPTVTDTPLINGTVTMSALEAEQLMNSKAEQSAHANFLVSVVILFLG